MALVVASLALPGSAPAADPPLRLRIDGQSLVVPADVLADTDVARSRPVTVRYPTFAQQESAGGVSMRKFLGLVGISPDAVTSIGIQGGAGTATRPEFTISGAEIRDGFGSADPVCPNCEATLDGDYGEGTVSFFRPLRSGTDVNAPDHVQPAIGQSLFVRVESTAPRIPVNITVSDPTPEPGKPVELRANLPGGGSSPTFTWYLGDGTTATGATITHSYVAGRWTAGVLAHDGTGYGAAAAVFDVGEPQAGSDPTPTSPPTGGSGGPSKSNGSGGGGGGSGSGKGGAGAGAASDGARDPDTSGDKPSRSTTSSATPAPSPAPAPAPAASPEASVSPAPTSTPASTTPPADQPSQPSTGTRVEGQLVDPSARPAAPLAGALAAADALARAQPKSSPERSGQAGGRSIVESAASGMLLIGLLGAGALTELRRSRRATPLIP